MWTSYDLSATAGRFCLIVGGLLAAPGIGILRRVSLNARRTLFGLVVSLGSALVASLFAMNMLPSGPTSNALIILLPLSAGYTLWSWTQFRKFVALPSACICVGLIGLILTRERSAWLALCIGFVGVLLYASNSKLLHRWLFGFVVSALVLLLLGVVEFAHRGQLPHLLASTPLHARLPLWYDCLTLIEDFIFTGIGLGSTTMGLSSYVYLLHVPYQDQAHNLYLEIMLELGLLGIVSFLAVMGFAAISLVTHLRKRNSSGYSALLGTSVALASMLVYGLFDSEGYVSPLVSILFLPLCSVTLLTQPQDSTPLLHGAKITDVWILAKLFGFACAFLALPWLWPTTRAQLTANWGSVLQTQAELAIYHWPEWRLQDELRIERTVDLSKAIRSYQTALKIDPRNTTANRRLGQIELSRGEITAAQYHLKAALDSAPSQRATRQLLGEVHALEGDFEEAFRLWRDIDVSHGQLEVRLWWYQYHGSLQQFENMSQAISLFNLRMKQSLATDKPNDFLKKVIVPHRNLSTIVRFRNA